LGELGVFKRELALVWAEKALRAAFQTFAYAGGFYGYRLPDMSEVAKIAAPYYNNDLRGGEGHMEVGKLILNVVKSKATMTLSVKPFGCMPSSGVSDGVQSLITERFPGTIFCAVETNGDGAVNFQSRVQMYLFKARQAELDRALAETGAHARARASGRTHASALRVALLPRAASVYDDHHRSGAPSGTRDRSGPAATRLQSSVAVRPAHDLHGQIHQARQPRGVALSGVTL
jgi:hypothetical protein